MRLILLLAGFSVILMTVGCATPPPTITKGEAYPEMYEEHPESILVVPAINHSTAADAPILYESTINQPLSNAGFYVLPIEVTNRFLRNEGLSDGDLLKDVPPQKFAEPFGADAVLYVTIDKWDTNYNVLSGNVVVGAEFIMKSCKTGNNLWLYRDQIIVNTSGSSNSNGGLVGLVASMIETAIKTGMQDYVPVARVVNGRALHSMPFGKYHKLHNEDQSQLLLLSKVQKVQSE